MNQSQTNDYQPQVRQISQKHLFFFLLKRWRSLIAVILIGALLGCAYGYYKDSKIVISEPYDPFASGKEADAQRYHELEKIYRNYQLVNEDADRDYLVHLPEDVQYYTGTLSAYVDAENSITTGIMGQVLNVCNDEAYLEALAEIVDLSPEMNRSSLSPILRYSYAEKNGTFISVYVGLDRTKNATNYGLLTYTLHYVTSEQFDRVIEYLKGRLSALNEAYQADSSYDYKFEILGVTKTEESLSTTFSIRNDAAKNGINNLNSFMSILEATEKTTSPYDGSALGKYFRSHVLAGGSGDTAEASADPVMKKMIILGAFGMIAAWGVCWILIYLLRDRIYTAKSLASEYGLLVLGTAEGKPVRNPVDRFLARLERRRQPNSLEYLARSLAALKEDSIVLCRISQDPADDALTEQLLEKNEKLWAADVTCDADVFEKAGDNAAVVFLVHLGLTKSQELTSAMQVCRLHGYRTLGAVLIAE